MCEDAYAIKANDEDFYIKDDYVFYYDEGSYSLIAYIGDEKELELPIADDVTGKYYIGGYAYWCGYCNDDICYSAIYG